MLMVWQICKVLKQNVHTLCNTCSGMQLIMMNII